ncbi:ATP-binding protein [uncultured Aquimonas sp.]|jgi:ATP-dependent DNA helicase RecG|uniref:ATP-binding protein n=1 Tax=uncultured Aquimonas sp. TaxID=385483 RepID=UPI00086CC404|nr:ATP-binding protein [uncultured Aquimonas sp.]ODU45444.1 MAG: transcriptional regulator [Xanthomonadaceae bacterium SCN 69-123]
MLTPDQLMTLLVDLESDRIERTTSTSNTDKFSEAVCAFANDYPNHRQPGYLILGAKDDGALSGLVVSDELLRNLAGIRSDGNVLPPPAMSVQKYVFPEGELAVVEVQPSTLPPVRYKGRVHIRVGPRKGYANEQEERILSERRAALVTSFDAHPLREAGLADLTMRLFDEYRLQTIDSHVIEENHRTAQDKLASLRCFDLTAGVPTVAGILLFGNNPRYFLPGAYVQFLRFPGETMTDRPDDALVVSGDLRTVLDTVRQKIVAYNAISVQQGEGFRDKEAPDYPEWALRELFHNAVMHRDYQSSTPIRFYWFADRIEIQSPGGLYGEVTRETLERRNSYRNPVLAEAMRSMEFVNRYGYGIQRAQKLLQDNGNPAADFEIDDKVFLVTLRRRAK